MFCCILCCFVAKSWFTQFCRDLRAFAWRKIQPDGPGGLGDPDGPGHQVILAKQEAISTKFQAIPATFQASWPNIEQSSGPWRLFTIVSHLVSPVSISSLSPPSSLSAAPFYIPTGWSDQLSNWSVLVKAGWEQSRPGFSNLASSLCSSCLSPCLPLLAGADTVFKCPPPSTAFPRYS